MTAPTPGDGRLIARGYVQVDLQDNTEAGLNALLARLRSAEGGVTIPVTFDQKQVGDALGSLKPVRVPITVDRNQLNREMREKLESRPVSVPMTVDRAQIQRELKKKLTEKPVILPVTVDPKDLQKQLLAVKPVLILPVQVDTESIRDQIENMAPVTVPLHYGQPTGHVAAPAPVTAQVFYSPEFDMGGITAPSLAGGSGGVDGGSARLDGEFNRNQLQDELDAITPHLRVKVDADVDRVSTAGAVTAPRSSMAPVFQSPGEAPSTPPVTARLQQPPVERMAPDAEDLAAIQAMADQAREQQRQAAAASLARQVAAAKAAQAAAVTNGGPASTAAPAPAVTQPAVDDAAKAAAERVAKAQERVAQLERVATAQREQEAAAKAESKAITDRDYPKRKPQTADERKAAVAAADAATKRSGAARTEMTDAMGAAGINGGQANRITKELAAARKEEGAALRDQAAQQRQLTVEQDKATASTGRATNSLTERARAAGVFGAAMSKAELVERKDAQRAQLAVASAERIQRTRDRLAVSTNRVTTAEANLRELEKGRPATAAQIEAADQKAGQARLAAAAAAEKYRAADENLQRLQQGTPATAKQVTAATDRVTAAQRTRQTAAESLTSAERTLDRLQKGVPGTADEVAAASTRVDQARRTQASAAGRLQVAEASLQELQGKGNISAARMLAAEERVAAARRTTITAAERTKAAEAMLDTTRKGTVGTADQLTEADRRVEASKRALATVTDRLKAVEAEADQTRKGTPATAAQVTAAEGRVASARAAAASATQKVSDAEATLNRVQSGRAATAEELRRAEQNLTAAKLAQDAADRAVIQTIAREEAATIKLGTARRNLPGKHVLPYYAELVDNTGPAQEKLRTRLLELQRLGKITPKYEARLVEDEMGQFHVRYIKLHNQTGLLAGEVLGKQTYKSFANAMRVPGLFGPVIAGAAAAYSALAILAVPKLFAQWGVQIQSSNLAVSKSFGDLSADVKAALLFDSASLASPIVRANQTIGESFQELRPQMRDIWDALPNQIDMASVGVTRFANNAMPGLVMAVDRADPVVAGLRDGLGSLGEGVTRFYSAITTAAPEAGQTLRTIGVIASDAGEMVGRVGAAVTSAFGGQLWDTAEALFERLFNVIGNIAETALPKFAVGVELAGQMFNVALAAIEPFSGILGTIVGTVLGATVAVRGLSVAMGLLGAAKVLSGIAPLQAAFTKLEKGVAAAGNTLTTTTTKWGGYITNAGNAAKAGELVARSTDKLSGFLRGVGNNLPIIGAALVGLGLAYDSVASKADDLGQAVAEGEMTLREAVAKEKAQLDARNAMWETAIMGLSGMFGQQGPAILMAAEALGLYSSKADNTAQATANVEAAQSKYMSTMGQLETAQARVSAAQAAYDEALKVGGPTSAAARTAAEELAAANDDLAAKQAAAEEATRSHTEAIIEQTGEMQGLIDTGLAYEDALNKVADAQKKAAEELAKGGKDSAEYKKAIDDLERAMQAQAKAAENGAKAAYAGKSANEQGAKAAEAYRTELLRTAETAGPAGEAWKNLVDNMDDAGLNMLSATAAASGLNTEIVKLPSGREVRVVVKGDRGNLPQIQDDFKNLEDKQVTVVINGEPLPAQQALETVLDAVRRGDATVDINGNPVPVGEALATVLGLIGGAEAKVKIGGEELPAKDALARVLQAIAEGKASVNIDGNDVPINEALGVVVAKIMGTVAPAQLDADPTKANAVLAAWGQLSTQTTGITQLDSNPVLANQVRDLWKSTSDATTGMPILDADGQKSTAVLTAWEQLANRTTGIPALDSNPALADAILANWKAGSDTTTGLPKLDADPQLANTKFNTWKDGANGTTAMPKVDADTKQAFSAFDAFKEYVVKPILSTVTSTITTIYKTITGAAAGGVFGTAMADGGVLPMANGGAISEMGQQVGHHLTPMSAGRAQVVQPNSWRIIGDRPHGEEAFIPLDETPRSKAILGYAAKEMGYGLTPLGRGKPRLFHSGGLFSDKDAQRAAWEMLRQIQSGGQFFEDFSFYGDSRTVAKWNDRIAKAFYKDNRGFDFGDDDADLQVVAAWLNKELKKAKAKPPKGQGGGGVTSPPKEVVTGGSTFSATAATATSGTTVTGGATSGGGGTAEPAESELTDIQKAAKEMLTAAKSGAKLFEDFSYWGQSNLVGAYNDALSQQFYADNRGVDFAADDSDELIEEWLQKFVNGSHNPPAPTTPTTPTTPETPDDGEDDGEGGGDNVTINIRHAEFNLEGTWDFADGDFPRKFIKKIKEQLRDYERSCR